jgi:medium-chain acyl-[acyl-carrier-protein] hydrolase
VSNRFAAATGSPWVVRHLTAGKPALRLFCFAYAGAGASAFRSWAALLAPWIELCAVQLPGRESRIREPLHHRLAELVIEAADGMESLLEPPFAFFGHSLGALLAFELCRTFRREGRPLPERLLVSAHAPPQLAHLRRLLYKLPDQELLQELRRYDGTPEAVLGNAELVQLLLPVVRADFELLDTYTYAAEPPFEFPISAFAALDDPEVRSQDVESWVKQTLGSFTFRQFPGGHLFLQTAARELVEDVCSDLRPLASAVPPQLF